MISTAVHYRGRLSHMGGATDFKVGGTKQDSRAEGAKKNFVPPTFPNVGVQASKYH